jgi:hypothetical protein
MEKDIVNNIEEELEEEVKETKRVVKKEAKKEEEEKELDILDIHPDDTPEKIVYRKFLANYKKQNPEKFEMKREAFEKNLEGNIRIDQNKSSQRVSFYFN